MLTYVIPALHQPQNYIQNQINPRIFIRWLDGLATIFFLAVVVQHVRLQHIQRLILPASLATLGAVVMFCFNSLGLYLRLSQIVIDGGRFPSALGFVAGVAGLLAMLLLFYFIWAFYRYLSTGEQSIKRFSY